MNDPNSIFDKTRQKRLSKLAEELTKEGMKCLPDCNWFLNGMAVIQNIYPKDGPKIKFIRIPIHWSEMDGTDEELLEIMKQRIETVEHYTK